MLQMLVVYLAWQFSKSTSLFTNHSEEDIVNYLHLEVCRMICFPRKICSYGSFTGRTRLPGLQVNLGPLQEIGTQDGAQ